MVWHTHSSLMAPLERHETLTCSHRSGELIEANVEKRRWGRWRLAGCPAKMRGIIGGLWAFAPRLRRGKRGTEA